MLNLLITLYKIVEKKVTRKKKDAITVVRRFTAGQSIRP